jgi:glycolate oxidase iron-sulfur subunit
MVVNPLEIASRSRPGSPSGQSGQRYEDPAGRLSDQARLLALADQCVMCGLCLPHCPTYRISLDEAESPRGRIALGRSLASVRLAPSESALTHLDQCLTCLSCQKVCPSEVRYEEIITLTRALPVARRPRSLLHRVLSNPQRLVMLAKLGAAVRASRWLPRLARALPRGSRWRTLGEQIPDPPPMPARIYPTNPTTPTRGPLTLFRGCVASVYDRDTHAAARVLLEALGYEVRIPAGTPCCGALSRHAGELACADAQSAATRVAIAQTGAASVLVSASGCLGDLRDHASDANGPAIVDIHAFLARDAQLDRLRFRPLGARVALHLPCTQVNVVGEVPALRSLLARIPDLTVLDLPEQPRCCGAAGTYFIEHPQIANRLRGEKIAQIDQQRPDLLLTTNIGCRIQFDNGMRGNARAVPVLHPLTLLARQLDMEPT